MEGNNSFNDLLFKAIIERQQAFDSYVLPKLHDEYKITHSSIKTIRTVLIKKGVIHDDPYQYDNKTSDIEIPETTSFLETERASIIGRRVSQYEAMVDFITNYWTFTCDFLTVEKIGKLITFNKTFSWENFSTSTANPNTRGLAELLANIRNSGDSLSIGIINDSLNQLSKASLSISKNLKNLTEFHRERYKAAVRKLVLPNANITEESVKNGFTNSVKEVKKSFAIHMKAQPFYLELIEEILKEDFSPEHAVLQQELINKLSTTITTSEKGSSQENFKSILLDGLRTLGSASPQIEDIINKLVDNYKLVTYTKKTFFTVFSAALKKAFNIASKEEDITIVTIDPVTQTSKKETLAFIPFIEELKRKSRILTGFSIRTSATYQKIEIMSEQQIVDLLTRYISELNTMLLFCVGLDEYFKQTATQEKRDKIRGIKIEISAIKNNIIKANQCRAEYVSQIEEQEQLKKLGITNV